MKRKTALLLSIVLLALCVSASAAAPAPRTVAPQSLSGSFVVFDPAAGGDSTYLPGVPGQFAFRLETFTNDWEYFYLAALRFPAGWTISNISELGSASCSGGGSVQAFSWAAGTTVPGGSAEEAFISHHFTMAPSDHCVATYLVSATPGSGPGDALVDWYLDGDGFGYEPHHPCSNGYTPPLGQGACNEAVNPAASIPVHPPDLAVSIDDGKLRYVDGSTNTYTVVVTNDAAVDATGVGVIVPLPAGTTTATWSCVAAGSSSCGAAGSGAIADTANVNAGEQVTYTFTLGVPLPYTGDLVASATITPPAGFVDHPGNNIASDTDTDQILVSIGNATAVGEGDPAPVTLFYMILLDQAAVGGEQITVNPTGGTATSGVDYTPPPPFTHTFNPGDLGVTYGVDVLADTVQEPNETVVVTLSSPVGLAIRDGSGSGTITDNDQKRIALGTATATEGGSLSFPVTFTGPGLPLDGSESFSWRTLTDGTATAADFTAVPPTVVTPGPGVTTVNLVVPTTGDALAENDESVRIEISSINGLWVTSGATTLTARGTIFDDDCAACPVIDVGDLTLAEPGANTTANFPVTLSAPAAAAVSFRYMTVPGTATSSGALPSDLDYTHVGNGLVTIPAGATTGQIPVTIRADALYEGDETFEVVITSITTANAQVNDGTGAGTILDNETFPTLMIENFTVGEGTSAVVGMTVTMEPRSATDVNFDWATFADTAIPGAAEDFDAATGANVTIPANTSSVDLAPIGINNDAKDEPVEWFFVKLSDPNGATISIDEGRVAINDNDSPPNILATSLSVAEGAAANVTVSLTDASGYPITVEYDAGGGTATVGADYEDMSGVLTFLPGETAITIAIPTEADTMFEGDETFDLVLSNDTNGGTTTNATITILDDDDGTLPVVSINDVSVLEPDAGNLPVQLTLTLSKPADHVIRVTVTTADGTAESAGTPSDYVTDIENITFAAGQTSATFVSTVNGDTLGEGNETYTVTISGFVDLGLPDPPVTIAAGAASIGTVTILDNDTPPVVSVDDVTLVEGSTATFRVTLSRPLGEAVTVGWETQNGTATVAGGDYTPTNGGTVSIAAGTVVGTITVPTANDLVYENTEHFSVHLTGVTPSGDGTVALGDSVGNATLLDNEEIPQIRITDVDVAVGESAGPATIDFTLSEQAEQTVTASYVVLPDTATTADYTLGDGTITFAPGVTTASLVVNIDPDAIDEPAEFFEIHLYNAAASGTVAWRPVIADEVARVTITDDDAAPELLIVAGSGNDVGEGNAGTTLAPFTVTLNPASVGIVTVDYVTAAISATAGSDFEHTTGTLTFAPGETSLTVYVPVIGDTTEEPDETFRVDLSNANGATITGLVADRTMTILDDEAAPSISISDVTVVETNGGTVGASFTVTLSRPASTAVTVQYNTADGTATAGTDYTALALNTLTFAAGQTSRIVTVSVGGDAMREADEVFYLDLSSVSANATIADPRGTATVKNDDPLPVISLDEPGGAATVAEGASITFNVVLSHPSSTNVTVGWQAVSGTATSGVDFTPVAPATVTFLPGDTVETITVNATDDLLNESTETFYVNLYNASANAVTGDSFDWASITDGDADPAIDVVTVSSPDPEETDYVRFNVTLSAPNGTLPVTVNYRTVSGTAFDGADFEATSGRLVFPPGETSITVRVPLIDDAVNEPDETFDLVISEPVNGVLGAATATFTISDTVDASPQVFADDARVVEGNSATTPMTFEVSLTRPAVAAVDVSWELLDGNDADPNLRATVAGNDYVDASGTVTIPAGDLSATITVDVVGDLAVELNERFRLNLIAVTSANATIAAGGDAEGTIQDDDAVGLPVVNIVDPPPVAEGNAGSTGVTLTVNLSHGSATDVVVSWQTVPDTAVAPADFAAQTGTVTIPAGSLAATFPITGVAGDLIDEPDEAFFVQLETVTSANATIGRELAVVTITDDDALPALSFTPLMLPADEGDEGTTLHGVALQLTPAAATPVSVFWATAAGTATEGVDFSPRNETITFAPGETIKSLTFDVIGDRIDEDDETVTIWITTSPNATLPAPATATITIEDDDAAPVVTIDDVSVTEPDSGSAPAGFTVNLSNPSENDIVLTLTVTPVDAAAGTDFGAVTTPVTFVAGETSRLVVVPILGDTEPELNETFTLSAALDAASPGMATTGDSGTGTIVDNDSKPTLTVHDLVVDEDVGTAQVTVAMSIPISTPVTVAYSFGGTGDTAIALSGPEVEYDYDDTNPVAEVTFAANETTKTIAVPINADTISELDEMFTVNLGVITGPAQIGRAAAVVTIRDDEPLPLLSFVADVTVAEPDGTAAFTVAIDIPSSRDVELDVVTTDGTARNTLDYTPHTQHVVIPAGSTSIGVDVSILDDAFAEPDETYFVNIVNPVNAAVNDSQATGTITDAEDVLPGISINDVSQLEGNAGISAMQFNVTLTAPAEGFVTVNWATADGGDADPLLNATTADADYAAGTGTVFFAPGVTAQTVTVFVNGDIRRELDESFLVNLTGPAGALVTDAQAEGTLENDDDVPTLTIEDVSIAETDAGVATMTFAATLSSASSDTISFDWDVSDGTATTADGDYVDNGGTVSFAPGVTSQTFSLGVNGDVLYEADETVFIEVSNAVNVAVNPHPTAIPLGVAVGTILNDDAVPNIAINGASVVEGQPVDGPTSFVTFNVVMSPPSGVLATVAWQTADGTATVADNDYVAASGLLQFLPGETNKTVTITVNTDRFDESVGLDPFETFQVLLSTPQNAQIPLLAAGTGQIENDDYTTTVTLVSVPDPSNYLDLVTITATIDTLPPDPVNPTGEVAFYDGASYLGTAAVVLPARTATITTNLLTGGVHDLEADYSGDHDYLPSSGADTHTVNPLPTLTVLAATPNPAVEGQTFLLTATVTASAGVPTGTVEFYDGATLLGTSALSGGVATLNTSLTGVAIHNLTASYLGDGNYQPSTGLLSLQVIPVPATVDLSESGPFSGCEDTEGVVITFFGEGFLPGTLFYWDGAVRPTSVISPFKIEVTIPASDLNVSGLHAIRLIDPWGSVVHDGFFNVSEDDDEPEVNPPAPITIWQTIDTPVPGASPATSAPLDEWLAKGKGTDDCSPDPQRMLPLMGEDIVSDSTFFPGGKVTITFRFRDSSGNVGEAKSYVIVQLFGSLDSDGDIDAVDLTILANYLVGNVTPGTPSFPAPLAAADLNGDGAVDAVDYQILSQYLVGNIPYLPMP